MNRFASISKRIRRDRGSRHQTTDVSERSMMPARSFIGEVSWHIIFSDGIRNWSEPPASPTARFRSLRGLILRRVDWGRDIAPLRRRPHCVRWRPSLCWFSVLCVLLTVDRARLHFVTLAPSPCPLLLDRWNSDARDFVAGSSSPAAWARSSRTAEADRSSLLIGTTPSCLIPR